MGSGSRVDDRQGGGYLEDDSTKCRWGCSDELSLIDIIMGAPFLFLVVGAVHVDVVNRESKTHAFVGWLSGRKVVSMELSPLMW